MNTATEPTRFAMPELQKGELYAGAIIQPDGTGHHTILLPGDNDYADWNTQIDWAKSLGGDLPDRVEGPLLFKFLEDEFKSEWYWLNTQHASNSAYAWCQGFDDGNQDYGTTRFKLRARAVRRTNRSPPC